MMQMTGAKKHRAPRLSELLDALDEPKIRGMQDPTVAGLHSDSRAVGPGDVFVAVKGVSVDGHDFVLDAEARGAVACVTERRVVLDNAVNVVVGDSAKALALLAARFYGDPAQELCMVGVTGTNGKTSTTHLLRAIVEKSGWGKMGIVGTIGHGVGDTLEANVHTTPDPLTLHRLLRDMKAKGCIGVVMEVSSHAVRQQRTWGIDYEIGMLTNVTRDHLDYHSSFDDYVGAKREFCYSLVGAHRRKKNGVLVFSLDNEQSRAIGEGFTGNKISVSAVENADVFADRIDASLRGTRFQLHAGAARSVDVHLQLLGIFSVSNALLAAAAARELGIDLPGIKAGLESVTSVPGRFEALGGRELPRVIVDYSHTPDSLERTLEFCRGLAPKRL
jgi:UDP-N-acetylmuramyl-tripeptide synthetase